jgi:hypothetical protein
MRTTDKLLARKSLASFGAAAAFAVTALAAQVAGNQFPEGAPLDSSGSYASEVQACKAGRTGEDLATCLKEARNAQADRKRGVLDNSTVQFQANARARCNALGGEDKAACEARMMGYGTVSGSVSSGGLLREVETVVMPPGQSSVTVDAKTSEPVLLVPQQTPTGATELVPQPVPAGGAELAPQQK